MAPPAKTTTDQVREINKLVQDALDSLRQVILALQSLEQRLSELEPR